MPGDRKVTEGPWAEAWADPVEAGAQGTWYFLGSPSALPGIVPAGLTQNGMCGVPGRARLTGPDVKLIGKMSLCCSCHCCLITVTQSLYYGCLECAAQTLKKTQGDDCKYQRDEPGHGECVLQPGSPGSSCAKATEAETNVNVVRTHQRLCLPEETRT